MTSSSWSPMTLTASQSPSMMSSPLITITLLSHAMSCNGGTTLSEYCSHFCEILLTALVVANHGRRRQTLFHLAMSLARVVQHLSAHSTLAVIHPLQSPAWLVWSSGGVLQTIHRFHNRFSQSQRRPLIIFLIEGVY